MIKYLKLQSIFRILYNKPSYLNNFIKMKKILNIFKLKNFNFVKTNIFFFVCLAVIVFALYAKSVNYDLLDLDDKWLISDHLDFLTDYKNLPKLFVRDVYYQNLYLCYRPVLNLSFMTETLLFGFNSKVYHITNIILFILSIWMMYVFLLKLNFNKNILKFIFLLIAVHPILSSVSVWVAGRNDSLLAIFAMLSLINFISYLQKNNWFNFLMTIFFFAVSVLTKEMGLILLPMYLVLIYCFDFKVSKKQFILFTVAFIAVVIPYFYVRSITVPGVQISEYINNWKNYVINMGTGLTIYIEKFFFPKNVQIVLYEIGLKDIPIFTSLITIIFTAYIFYKKIIDRKIVIFGVVWYVLFLIPSAFMPDHIFLYHRFLIPSIGVIVILISLIDLILKKYNLSELILQNANEIFFEQKINFIKIFTLVAVILFCIFTITSYKNIERYKNSRIFWNHSFSTAPDFPLARANIAYFAFQDGNKEKAYNLLNTAKTDYTLRFYATYFATVLYKQGFLDEALKIATQSYEKPEKYEILRDIYKDKNDIEKAIECAEVVYKFNKNNEKNNLILQQLYKLRNPLKKFTNDNAL